MAPYIIKYTTNQTLKYRSVDDLDALLKHVNNMVVCGVLSSKENKRLTSNLLKAKISVLLNLREYHQIYFDCFQNQILPDIEKRIEKEIVQEKFISTLKIDLEKVNGVNQYIEVIDDILQEIDQLKSFSKQTISSWTALVETTFRHDGSRSNISGLLSPLTVVIDNINGEAQEDFITFNHKTISVGDLIYNQIEDAFQIAKKFVLGNINAGKLFYHAAYSFPDMNALYTGNSLGVAFSLVTISALSKMEGATYEYVINPMAATTGMLELTGDIHKVAPESLRLKVEAVFHSPISQFIIPSGNQAEAMGAYNHLLLRFPNKHLEIIPVNSLSECLNHTDIVVKKKRSLALRFKSRRFKQRILTYTTAFIIIFLTGILSLLLINNNPVDLKINETTINAINANGRVLWSYDFENKQYDYSSSSFINNLDIYDYDNDGKNEIIYLANTRQKRNIDIIHYFESNGEVKWTYRVTDPIIYGSNVYQPMFHSDNIKSIIHENNRMLFCVLKHSPYFPCKIMEIKPDGSEGRYFWNAGVISSLSYFDIDQDNDNELIATGTNNDYDQAVMAIFSINKISGYSPEDDIQYIPQGESPGTFKYYIRFPRLSDLLNDIARESATKLLIAPNGQYKVEILTRFGDIVVVMEHSLRVIRVEYFDGFLDQYYDKYSQHFDEVYSRETIFNYMKNIEFWDGDNWTTTPTINKLWYD